MRGGSWRGAIACAVLALLFASPSPAPAKSEGDRELVVWGAWRRRGLDAAFRRFEKEHPGWKIVTSTAVGAGQMDPQKLMCAIAGGSPPDTLIQDRLSIGEWALRDAFLPLDEMIATSRRHESLAVTARDAKSPPDRDAALKQLIAGLEMNGDSLQLAIARELFSSPASARAQELVELCQAIRAEQFYDTCWQEACFGTGQQRRVYAVPNTTDVRLLYYNEDVLERAGFVDAEGRARPPRDWDELRDYAVKLSERDASGKFTRVGFGPLLGQGFLYHYAWLNGGEFVTPDGRTCTLDAPANVESLAYIVDVYDRLGGVERVEAFKSTFQSGGEVDPFLVGNIAMMIDSDYFQSIIANHAPRMRFAVAPPPAPKGKESVTWSGGFSWVIPNGAKHPEMAFELIRFLTTDRTWMLRNAVEERYAASRGTSFIPEMAPLPHVNQMTYDRFVKDNPDLPQRFKRHLLLFAEMMKASRYRPVTPVGQLLWDEHIRATEKATRHTLEPKEALRRGRETVQKRLDQVHAEGAELGTASRAAKSAPAPPIITISVIAAAAVALGAVLFAARRSSSGSRAEALWGFVFASPWLFGFVVLTVGPIVASIVYSFCHYDGLHAAKFIGFDNYRKLFTDDPLFWRSLANTAFMMLGVPLGLAISLVIAMLLNSDVRGIRVYRTIFYLPAIVPVVASALLWIWVLNPDVGLINSLLRALGVNDPPGWLASPSWLLGSKTAIIIMGLWVAGPSVIIWIAGLKGIPRHLYEAAEIDGAGPWSRFRNVTLPMLSPYLFFNLIVGVIGTMQIFSQAYIMTGGGPDDSTLFYAYYVFNTAFRYFQMGYASAMAWILFLIVLALTLFQMWVGRGWVHYETA